MARFETTGIFGSVEDITSVLPFYFNAENSNISIEMYIDGLVSVVVTFGNGKGWNTLEEDLVRETECSDRWGAYTMGVNYEDEDEGERYYG